MDCAYFNAVSKIIDEIICSLNCGWIAEDIALNKRRKEVLIKNFFSKAFDKSIFRQIIPATDSTVNVDNSFHAIFNSDSTKFISFFLEKVTDSAKLQQARLGMIDPQYPLVTEEYVVYGVNYKNKWYYSTRSYGLCMAADQTLEGRRKDLFNHLQFYDYGFFKDESIEPDPAFWETNLFGIVGSPGAYRFPDKTEELNNAPYKGLYVIVARKLREERRKAEKIVEEELERKYIDPLIQKLNLESSSKKNFFIFPIGMHTILVPITQNMGGGLYKARYYVLIPDAEKKYKVFEWTYFNNSDPKKYAYVIYDEIGKLTYWNARIETVEDKNFWNNYVLMW